MDNLVEQGLHGENSVFQGEQEAMEYAKQQGICRVDIVGEDVRTVDVREGEAK